MMNSRPDDFDFLSTIEDEVAVARRVAARAIDRATALVELRSHALEMQEKLQRPVRPIDVLQPLDPNDEETRARLSVLVDRIAPEEDN